jgi:hypothetical protein
MAIYFLVQVCFKQYRIVFDITKLVFGGQLLSLFIGDFCNIEDKFLHPSLDER